MQTGIVEFNGRNIITAKDEISGDVYVAMKPFVEDLGLEWKRQYRKLQSNERYGLMYTTFETPGGKQEMLALNIKHLPAYLHSINPNKVRPDIRDVIIAYQDECFLAINNYWNEGIAVNPRMKIPDDPIMAQIQMIQSQAKITQELYMKQLEQDKKINTIEAKVNEIIEEKESALKEIASLPKPEKKAKEITKRKSVSKLINAHCKEMHRLQQEAYTDLYVEFKYRYGIDVNARMKSGKYKTKLDVIEDLGMIDELYSLAYEMFGREAA